MAQIQDDKHNKKTHHQTEFCKQLRQVALKVVLLLRYYLDLFIDKIFSLYFNSRVRPIKKATNPLVLESATSLASKIRKGEVKCEDVVRAFVDRIRDVNGLLNAVVDDRFEEALEEACALDKDIATGNIQDVDFQSKPFLGVPFTSKESTACQHLSYTFGLLKRKGRKAHFDADIVAKMKAAGGILLGVTNIPQLNLWQETSNTVYGITNNPYNNTRNVGGSSGGEASIIAACGSPLGLGTDIGGSLRIPAFMCGIFGHKPTCDLVSTNGLTFRTGKEQNTMVVAGPMTKYADDLIPCLKVLLGDNETKLKLNQPVIINKLRVFYVKNPKDVMVSPFREEVKNVFTRVVNHFAENLSEEPQPLEIDELKYGGRIWAYWMRQEANANFNRDIANREGEVNSLIEIVKYFTGQSEFTAAVVCNLINNTLPAPEGDWARNITKLLQNKLNDILGPDGVLLYPSAPWPASYHHTALLRPWNFNLFAIWNALKFPVTQVPLGLGKDGLPLGLQVVAAPYQDHLCIAVAKELERAFGGYVPPFKIKN